MLDLADVRQSLRSLMWRNVGIVRNGDRLAETVEIIDFWRRFVLDKTFDEPRGWEIQNMLLLAKLVVRAALERCESRGVHYRDDCGESPRDDFAVHLAYRLKAGEPVRDTLDLDFRATDRNTLRA
jgi:L-aspartate oxidase